MEECLKPANPIMVMEDSMLQLASTKTTDGIYYMCILQKGCHTVARFFESGAFQGYFKARAQSKIQDALPWQVYNELDIVKNIQFNIKGSLVALNPFF